MDLIGQSDSSPAISLPVQLPIPFIGDEQQVLCWAAPQQGFFQWKST
jgi:hypothetical protein